MKIGDLEVDAGAPDAERLRIATGQSVASMRDLLSRPLLAGTVARALSACVEEVEGETRDLALWARTIAAEGVSGVRAEVLKLYEEADTLVLDAEAEVAKVTKKGGKNASRKAG